MVFIDKIWQNMIVKISYIKEIFDLIPSELNNLNKRFVLKKIK